MIRALIVAFASLIASGCGLPSAVDAAPFGARLVESPFPDGVYCGLDDDEDGLLVIRSAEEEGDNNCAALTWDASRRLFIMTDESDDAKAPGKLALADLGDGLLLLQFEERPEDDLSEKPWSLMVGMVQGDFIGILPLVSDQRAVDLAASYPSITLSKHHIPFMTPSVPADAPPGIEPPQSAHHYVSAGAPEDVRSLARDIALMMLRAIVAEANNKGPLPAHGAFLPGLVRVEAGVPDHPPSPAQMRDIDALMAKLRVLAE